MTDDRSRSGAAGARGDDVVPYERDARGGARAPRGAEAPTEALATSGAGRARASAPGSARLPRPPRDDARPSPSPRPAPGRRRAKLALTRVDPWSVFVLSLLASLFLGIVLLVALAVLYSLLQSLGVLDSLNTFAADLQIIKDDQTVLSLGRVLGVGAIVAAVDVVLLTLLATLGAFLYNVCASLTGGLEVVLGERE